MRARLASAMTRQRREDCRRNRRRLACIDPVIPHIHTKPHPRVPGRRAYISPHVSSPSLLTSIHRLFPSVRTCTGNMANLFRLPREVRGRDPPSPHPIFTCPAKLTLLYQTGRGWSEQGLVPCVIECCMCGYYCSLTTDRCTHPIHPEAHEF